MSTNGAILDMFDEVTEFYPGSKRPLVRHPNRVQPDQPDPDRWDAKSKTYTIAGSDIELFSVGQLAQALGRKPVTIRKWERLGIIPRATFHRPSDDPRGRRRLYSRAQVEGTVKIAEEEGVLDIYPHAKSITATKFTERVLALFRELALQ